MRTSEELAGVKSLGSGRINYTTTYDKFLLEKFTNKYPSVGYLVRLDCPEFTSLCPKTGQPDFAKLAISYIPDKFLVESKSLKLYLFSFRNSGDFSEDIVNTIMTDLVDLLAPKYIEVAGEFYPRGGISIRPFTNCATDDYLEFAMHRRLDYLRGAR